MALFIGTSGWAYKEWRPAFYPEGLSPKRFLSHYARILTACEINATFYRLPTRELLARWSGETPDGFRFAVKANRRLTHAGGGALDLELLDAFAGALRALGAKLGAVLFQFPPTRRRDDAFLARLLAAVPCDLPRALEFRHASWEAPEVAERVAAAGGTLCVADTSGAVTERLAPGPIGYVRLRAERYSPEAREAWRALLAREGERRPVYAFAKHEGVPAGDPFGGVGLAQWLVSARG